MQYIFMLALLLTADFNGKEGNNMGEKWFLSSGYSLVLFLF